MEFRCNVPVLERANDIEFGRSIPRLLSVGVCLASASLDLHRHVNSVILLDLSQSLIQFVRERYNTADMLHVESHHGMLVFF